MFGSRIITNKERGEIKKKLKDILKHYNPEISISDKPNVIHCKFSTGSGPWTEYDEFMYHFDIKSDKGDFSDSQSMSSNWSIDILVQIIAHEFFMRNDKDFNSPLVKELWKN